MINRPQYVEDLILLKDKTDLIKIVTGIRRCGKSTLFLLFQEYLKQQGMENNQILDINLEFAYNNELLDWRQLHTYIEQNIVENRIHYVFIDEIQLVKDFQKAINSLRLKQNIDLYVTGSNAFMFSSQFATLLSGRYVEIKMLPLSFKEYMSQFPQVQEIGLDIKFNDYLFYGSFPQVLDFYKKESDIRGLWDNKSWQKYMDGLYNTIIVKDIMKRQGTMDISRLEKIIKFMFSNIGNQTSINNIAHILNNDLNPTSDKKIHAQTIEKYIDLFLSSYIFYKSCPNYLKGKEHLRDNSKYYAADIGIRYFLLGGKLTDDAGHILENIVYLELLRRGYKVEFGKVKNKEIDFVASLPGGKIEYYQVAQTILDENTLKRELEPLEDIDDNYPKYLLSRDYNNDIYKGIEHKNVLQWLVE